MSLWGFGYCVALKYAHFCGELLEIDVLLSLNSQKSVFFVENRWWAAWYIAHARFQAGDGK